MPLHPAVVHFPLALAILMPLVVLVAITLRYRDRLNPIPSIIILATATLLAASTYVAVETGEEEEHVVEEVVPEAPLEEHEEQAELFLAMSLILLGVGAITVPLSKHKGGLPVMALVLLLSVVTAGQALRAGGSGGELVYVHGAAQAYTSEAPARVVEKERGRERPERERD